jgi:hypothetical protein
MRKPARIFCMALAMILFLGLLSCMSETPSVPDSTPDAEPSGQPDQPSDQPSDTETTEG